ncbi:MAG: adenosine deaminase, partial [Pseudomonadota bacterium]|nr:adenosine deaminase [Pseudomonadota bacterium]
GDYAYAFDMAREAGLRLTTHAGEWGGPTSVREALDDLKVERLGHGVQVIQDLALVDRLIEEDVVLEVCPGSNIVLGVYPKWDRHPIQALRERGVKVTVSTDDPPFFHTTMTREYEQLARVFGWGASDFHEISQTALDAAFCDADTKTRLADKLKDHPQ